MLTIYDEIHQLQVELAACILTSAERAASEAELAKLLAEQTSLDIAFDAIIADEEPPE